MEEFSFGIALHTCNGKIVQRHEYDILRVLFNFSIQRYLLMLPQSLFLRQGVVSSMSKNEVDYIRISSQTTSRMISRRLQASAKPCFCVCSWFPYQDQIFIDYQCRRQYSLCFNSTAEYIQSLTLLREYRNERYFNLHPVNHSED